MEDEISYLLRMPSEEIMREVLQEALKDLTITPEEQVLIAGIEHDLSIHSERIPKLDKDHPFSRNEVQILLLKQRRILKEIVSNTYKRAEADGTISSDEMNLYRVLLHKADEITAKKINMFMNFDSLTSKPNLLIMHDKIGQKFSHLTATLIMNIFSEKVNQYEKRPSNIQKVVDEFSSDDTNREFVTRFRETLLELVQIPMETPNDLLTNIDQILNKL
ncbi:MAG: hypothetical protein JSW11_16055 [Candidatus Heimdallarchaeota archaeon]|nr:MAG: hypothetical protein JSW11_16055 [Candidatus Heimdallarchaeota archaeon]